MGLLDGVLGDGWQDPQSQGMLALAGGLLQGNFGRGVENMGSVMANAQDVAMRRKMLQSDLEMKQLAERRAQAMFEMQQDAYKNIPGGGVASGAPMGGPSVSVQGGSPTITNGGGNSMGGGGDTNAQLVRLEKMAIAGVPGAKEAFELYKYRNDPQQLQPGTFSQNRVTGQREYIPDVKTGLTYGPNGISMLPGAENMANLAGMTTNAQEAAKNRNTLVPLDRVNPDTGRPYTGTIADLINASKPQGNGPFGSNGLDMSRVSPEQAARLAKLDPAAFAAGVSRFQSSPSGEFMSNTAQEANKIRTLAPLQATAEFNKTLMTKMADDIQASSTKAQSGQGMVRIANDLSNALDSGNVLAGPGASTQILLKQIGQSLGASPDDALTETRSTIINLSKLVMEARGQLKGSGSISDFETKALIKANAGDIEKMSVQELKAVANVAQKIGKLNIAQHSELMTRAAAGDPMKFYSDVGTPLDNATQKTKTVLRTGRYGGKKVLKYSDGSVEYAN